MCKKNGRGKICIASICIHLKIAKVATGTQSLQIIQQAEKNRENCSVWLFGQKKWVI